MTVVTREGVWFRNMGVSELDAGTSAAGFEEVALDFLGLFVDGVLGFGVFLNVFEAGLFLDLDSAWTDFEGFHFVGVLISLSAFFTWSSHSNVI